MFAKSRFCFLLPLVLLGMGADQNECRAQIGDPGAFILLQGHTCSGAVWGTSWNSWYPGEYWTLEFIPVGSFSEKLDGTFLSPVAQLKVGDLDGNPTTQTWGHIFYNVWKVNRTTAFNMNVTVRARNLHSGQIVGPITIQYMVPAATSPLSCRPEFSVPWWQQ